MSAENKNKKCREQLRTLSDAPVTDRLAASGFQDDTPADCCSCGSADRPAMPDSQTDTSAVCCSCGDSSDRRTATNFRDGAPGHCFLNSNGSEKSIKPIAHILTDFPSKFGIPRQSSVKEKLYGTVVLEPEYRRAEALRGLDGFSHIWLIWHFSEADGAKWSPTVRPPRLGGNRRVGVFASRSPFRPNSLGLSCVKLEEICFGDGQKCAYCRLRSSGDCKRLAPVLTVSGIDMISGTPIFDIKPYVPVADCHPEASEGYTAETKKYRLNAAVPDSIKKSMPEEALASLISALEDDPRPGYRHSTDSDGKIYRMEFADMDIPFSVSGDTVTVHEDIRKRRDSVKEDT